MWKEAGFSVDERNLISEVAQRLRPRLDEIFQIASDAPAAAVGDPTSGYFRDKEGGPEASDGRIEAVSEMLAEFGRVARRLMHKLGDRDVETAMAAHDRFCARLIRRHLNSDSAKDGLTIGEIGRCSRLLRETLDREIRSAFAEDAARLPIARLAYQRIWSLALESGVDTYLRLFEQQAREREHELRSELDSALELSRLKSASVAHMTHEIRTPLNVILGYADLMAERLFELHDYSGSEYGEPIRGAGQRMLDLIGAALDLSRIESGALELKPAVIRLADLVQGHVRDLGVLARRKGIGLVCQIDEPAAEVIFDEHCLSGAIINLVQNAIKFTDRGVVSIRVCRDRAGGLVLEVRDTGRGIDPAYLPRLFEPFTQEHSDSAPRREGAGLGLALVKRYVEFNRARIEVESRQGVGTTFTICFSEGPIGSCATG